MKALSNRPACVNNATLSWGDSRGPTKHKQKNKVHFQLKISGYQKSRTTMAIVEIFSENLKSYNGGDCSSRMGHCLSLWESSL